MTHMASGFTGLLHINVHFGDFVLLAILLSILYLITLMELWLSSEAKDDFGGSGDDRRNAASWAFFGIFFTLCGGVAVESSLVDDKLVLLAIPTLFLARWAYIHYVSSDVLDVALVLREIEIIYLQALREALLKVGPVGATITHLHSITSTHLGISTSRSSLKVVLPVIMRLGLPKPLIKGAQELFFTESKVEELLNKLIQSNEVGQRDGHYFLRFPSVSGA
jgi:hypothetical protein